MADLTKLHVNQSRLKRDLDVVALASKLAENGGESIARAKMLMHGFMPPELQVCIPDPVNPSDMFRVDFYWELEGGNVIGELDGHEKYTNPQMTNDRDIVQILSDERLRESHLTGSNAKAVRFSFADVMNTKKFCHLLTSFGIPQGYVIPPVALT